MLGTAGLFGLGLFAVVGVGAILASATTVERRFLPRDPAPDLLPENTALQDFLTFFNEYVAESGIPGWIRFAREDWHLLGPGGQQHVLALFRHHRIQLLFKA
jgi:hypothetical protein